MTRSEGLKAEGAITAGIDLFVAAVGAEIELGMENSSHDEEHSFQCEFMGNYTGGTTKVLQNLKHAFRFQLYLFKRYIKACNVAWLFKRKLLFQPLGNLGTLLGEL